MDFEMVILRLSPCSLTCLRRFDCRAPFKRAYVTGNFFVTSSLMGVCLELRIRIVISVVSQSDILRPMEMSLFKPRAKLRRSTPLQSATIADRNIIYEISMGMFVIDSFFNCYERTTWVTKEGWKVVMVLAYAARELTKFPRHPRCCV